MRAIRLSNDLIWSARCTAAVGSGFAVTGRGREVCPERPQAGRSRALVDAEGLPQVGGGLAGIAVLEVGPAESFQGSCLLEGHADVPRDGERLGVALAGLVAG
jgi:hypothetical protein